MMMAPQIILHILLLTHNENNYNYSNSLIKPNSILLGQNIPFDSFSVWNLLRSSINNAIFSPLSHPGTFVTPRL